MASFFDLDISFEGEDETPDLSKLPAAKLKAAIEQFLAGPIVGKSVKAVASESEIA